MKLMDNLKMLPELLFTVGPASMQDISRDDFSLLNGGEPVTSHTTDRDMCPTLLNRIQNPSPLNSHVLALPKHLSPAEDNVTSLPFAAVKLEDTNGIDLFPTHSSTWQQHPMNNHELAHHRLSSAHHHRFDHSNSKLLLQGSDDPLISHGANSVLSNDDEHPADFAKCLMTTADHQQVVQHKQELLHFHNSARIPQPTTEPQRPVKSGCSSLTKQQLKVKANLMSARNQQQQLQQQQKENNAAITPTASQKQRPPKTKKKPTNAIKLRFHHQALPPEYLSHYEATQGQVRPEKPTQKSTSTQQRVTSKQSQNLNKPSQPRNSHENVRSWLQKIAEIQRSANASKAENQQDSATKPNIVEKTYESQAAVSQRLTLDANNNPHNQKRSMHTPTTNVLSSSIVTLNAGVSQNTANTSNKRSVYFSDLPYMGEITLDNSKPRRGRKPKKADICHLIYKNYGTILSKRPDSQDCVHIDNIDLKLDMDKTEKAASEDQPLNLCLRDQPTDSYSISSADDASETNSSCPTPVTTPSDFVRDSMLANNLKTSLSNLNEVDKEKLIKAENGIQQSIPLVPLKTVVASDDAVLNPLTAYYQKLLESGVLLNNVNGTIKTIQKDNQLALKIPLPSGMFLPTKFEKPNAVSPAPSNCNSMNLEYPEQLSTPSSIKSENSTATNVSSSTVLGTVNSGQQQLAPQKRKRSAIFIPPMNTENTSNPATEVSICKFKFTGGSKPTLQEKKMLSVDAGGNYRYFSGTGDKTSRGYEYFPRESLQQTAGLLPGVNCTGQKLSMDIPPPSAGLSNEQLYIPESPTSSMLLNASSSTTNGNVMGTVSAKSPPHSPSFDLSKVEVPNYFVDNATYHPTATSSANALNNRFMVSRKKQALHQLRKSTQREKLEKTFKEQGFLIQTQQLESAEGATYCKFRQLKKFTRYLFRNWKDYLPDDLQRNSSAAALEAAAAAAEDFSHREQENKLATTTTAGVDDVPMATCIVENVMTCREENIL